ncbi:MAG: hypothetical protein QM493_07070 [Sulfurovum sp.]
MTIELNSLKIEDKAWELHIKAFSIKTELMRYNNINISSPPLYNVPKRGFSNE